MATDGILLWRELFAIAEKVCKQYGLKFAKMEPETRKQAHIYGETVACDRCYDSPYINQGNCRDKIIRIRIHQLNRPNRPLKLRTLLDTLAHELAHLDPDTWDHGRGHKAKAHEILTFIRELGYTG